MSYHLFSFPLCQQVIRRKLGFSHHMDNDKKVWMDLLDLLHQSGVDYVLFFRLLAEIEWNEGNSGGMDNTKTTSSSSSSIGETTASAVDVASVVSDLRAAFYDLPLHARLVASLRSTDLNNDHSSSSSSNSNSNKNDNKETARVMEVGEGLEEEPGDGSSSSSLLSLAAGWKDWLVGYHARLLADNRPRADRVKEQHQTNPKYVLRNWMAVMASEQVSD